MRFCVCLHPVQSVLTAAVESGYSTALFRKDKASLAAKWQQLAAFEPFTLQDDGTILDSQGQQVNRAWLQLCYVLRSLQLGELHL